MNTMVYTVILVFSLVLANGQGKVIFTDDDLPNSSNDISINKNYVSTDLQTSTTTTPMENEPKKMEPVGELESDDINIEENDVNFQTYNFSAPLILTPMIEKGINVEARDACRVDPSLFLGFESYSGFFTVNKTFNSNVFFWYFPVENKPVNETPWIIWLQGGPGVSSLVGLFDEIGPFYVDSENMLIKNQYTWLQDHSILFIDNPIGAGFSFTEHEDGFVKDMATYSKHLFSTVQQFLQVFPELRRAPLYVAGESYAGKYVPALAMELHKHKHRPGQDVNLQGIMIGNAFVDPAMIAQVPQSYYYFGLLEKEQIEMIEPLAKAFQRDITNNNSIGAKDKWTNLIHILLLLSNLEHGYNFLKDDISWGSFSDFFTKPEIKTALHVGGINFSLVNVTTNLKLAPDFLSSSKSLCEELLEHYKVLAYCGQLDQMLPCVFTSENYRTWQWSGARDFLRATRYPFMFDNRLAWYSKTGGRLTEVVVRGAGHMVSSDMPGPAQALVAQWIRDELRAPRNSMLEGNFVQEFVANSSILAYL